MSSLTFFPPELITLLCSFLSSSSLKAFRCTCKAYAALGEEWLFDDFEFRLFPNRDRLRSLEQLAARPTLSRRLGCLAYESGILPDHIDFGAWQASFYQDLEDDRFDGCISEHEYATSYAALQARFTTDMPFKYEEYSWRIDYEATLMAKQYVRDTLVQIMNTLCKSNPSLRLKTVTSEPQILLQDLEKFDPEKYIHDTTKQPDPHQLARLRRKNALAHLTIFFEASTLSDLKVTNLCAIDLPHQILTTDPQPWNNLKEAFNNLQVLEIEVSGFPRSHLISGGGQVETSFAERNLSANQLAELLDAPSHLSSLRLEFPEGKEAFYSFSILNRTYIELEGIRRLWLASVKTLNLCHFRCTQEDLEGTLTAARKLEDLTLRHCRLETGGMMELLEFLPGLRLKKLSLRGLWKVDEDSAVWHWHDETDVTDCAVATAYEGAYLEHGMRSKLENFALYGGECPLPLSNSSHATDVAWIWEGMGDKSWHYVPANVRKW